MFIYIVSINVPEAGKIIPDRWQVVRVGKCLFFWLECHSVRLYKLLIKNTFWPIGLIPVLKQFILVLKSIFKRCLSETFLDKLESQNGVEEIQTVIAQSFKRLPK